MICDSQMQGTSIREGSYIAKNNVTLKITILQNYYLIVSLFFKGTFHCTPTPLQLLDAVCYLTVCDGARRVPNLH